MATLFLAATHDSREVFPANGRTFELEELQKFVGGYIEALRVPGGDWMFLNEDGKRHELPMNQAATQIMAGRIALDDVIVGDVVVCSPLEAGDGQP